MGQSLEKLRKTTIRILEYMAEPNTILVIVLSLTFALTLLLRLAPMRWGIYLNEFDPYYEYYLAEALLKKGGGDPLRGIAWWFSWWFTGGDRDTLFWAPKGRDLRATSQPGSAIISSSIYVLLNALGLPVDLYTIHAFKPPIGAALAVFFIYLLGRELWGSTQGLLASILMACAWPFIYRTNLGAKHEGIAIPFMVLSYLLFLRACKKNSVSYALASGLSMIIVVLSWGGFLYPWNLVALIVLIRLAMYPTDIGVAKSYLLFIILTEITIAITPRFGPRIAFFSAAAVLPLLSTLASLLVVTNIMGGLLRAASKRSRFLVIGAIITAGLALGVAWYLGVLYTLPRRILAVIIPVWRPVGVTTVAEHAVPTWASIYGDYGLLIPLSAFGAIVSGYKSKKELGELFAFMLWLTSGYAASSMARLTLLFAPGIALLSSNAFAQILNKILHVKARGRMGRPQVSAELRGFALLVLILLIAPYLFNYQAIMTTHQPPLILSSSVPVIDYNYQYLDWLSALEWIKANVPEGSIIATWWDYGYWISVNTRRNTTCDNSTIDSKRIREIARAFLSSEEEALTIFKEMNVSYIVVFEPFLGANLPYLGLKAYFSPAYGGLGGDLAKSYQMARWIGEDPDKYITVEYIENVPILVPVNTPEALNATLYHLLFTKTMNRRFFVFEPLPLTGQTVANYKGPSITIPQPKYFELVYASQPNEWVLVFRVKYETP